MALNRGLNFFTPKQVHEQRIWNFAIGRDFLQSKNDNIATYFEELRHQIPLPVKADIYL